MVRADRSLANNTTLKAHLSGNKRCAEIAQALGISHFMFLSPRSDPHSTQTLNKAINALIGAVYVDSDCNKTTLSVLENLNWFSPSKEAIKPLTVHNLAPQYGANSDMPVSVEETISNQVNTISCPQEMPEQDTQTRLASLESSSGLHLQTLFRNIASPSTLAMLRNQVDYVLHAEHIDSHPLNTNVSAFERYTFIQTLGQKISYLQTVRHNHILQLYQQCGGHDSVPYTNIIQFDQGPKKPGNPLHRQDTEITLQMMRSIFPGTEPDKSSDTFNEVKQLRRVGKRLSTLVQHFGIGILGLMHDSEAVMRGIELAHLLFVQRLFSQVDHG